MEMLYGVLIGHQGVAMQFMCGSWAVLLGHQQVAMRLISCSGCLPGSCYTVAREQLLSSTNAVG